jgi:site-specific recombinase XerD
LREKGDKRRTIGLHYAAAQALHEYIHRAGLTSGPLFRPRRHSRTEELGAASMGPRTMWVILKGYLGNVPNAWRERELPSGEKTIECVYTPDSLRATAATLLLDSGVDIMEVKELLGHRHVTTTQIYDKRRRAAREAPRTRCRCESMHGTNTKGTFPGDDRAPSAHFEFGETGGCPS